MLQKTDFYAKKRILLGILLASVAHIIHGFTSNSRHGYDAFPMYSTLDPQEYLYRKERQWLKGLCEPLKKSSKKTETKKVPLGETLPQIQDEYPTREDCTERIQFSISPFMQFADRGRNIHNDEEYLGDLDGRWNMIALLFGQTPQGQSLPTSLETAKDNLFGHNIGVVANPGLYIDPQKQFGFFAVPLKYRKYGVRCEFDAMLIKDLGFRIQLGYACICQRLEDLCQLYDICAGQCCLNATSCTQQSLVTPTTDETTATTGTCGNCSHQYYTLPIDLTTCSALTNLPATVPTNSGIKQLTPTQVQFYLMNQLYTIAQELGLNLCNFNKGSIEDVNFSLYWRHAVEVNENRDDWAHFLFIPFIEGCFTAGVADCINTSVMYSAPFGNNGHNAIGARGGFLLDWTETVELGFEAGFTHFFRKSFSCYRMPNSVYQSGIYPFTTAVTVCPGLNCHLSLKLGSYHFLNRLSTYFQYVVVTHKDDQICLCKPDPAFQPCVLEGRSCWKTHLANIGFNYDISPNMTLGFLWQAPLSQKRAARTSTVMASLSFTY